MLKSFYNTCINFVLGLLFMFPGTTLAQSSYPINPNLDILHYTFSLNINDSNDEISGEATILFTLKEESQLKLDLIGLGDSGKGMVVEE